MSIYEENIRLIKEKYPSIYEGLSVIKDQTLEITLLETKEEKPALHIKKGDKEYRLNSSYKPLIEAKKWADQFNFSNMEKTGFLFGLGNGIFARELLCRLGENEPLVVVEPSMEIFQYVLQNVDITEILRDQRMALVLSGINESDFYNLAQTYVDWNNIYSKIICVHPQYDNLYPDGYENFLYRIKENDIIAIKNANTDARFGKEIVKNALHNLKFFEDGKFIKGFHREEDREIPVIIVSAGPSIKKNVEFLKEAKGKALIIAVDRVLDYLLDRGVEPDFVITMDPMFPLHLFSKREGIKIPMFCSVNSAQAVMNFHKGEKIFVYYDEYTRKLVSKLGKPVSDFNPGGSVANAAFYVCAILQSKKVILVGQDLAYDNDISHLDGERDYNPSDNDTMWVDDIYGDKIKTRRDWFTYLEWFQDAIALSKEMVVIDATEGGAKIKGSKIMTLQETIQTYCVNKVDCKGIFSYLPTMDENDKQIMEEYRKESISDLNIIKSQAMSGIRCCNEILLEYKKMNKNSNVLLKYMKKMKNINAVILSKPISELVDYYIKNETNENRASIYQIKNNGDQENIIFCKNAKSTYQWMIEASDAIKLEFNMEDSVNDDSL